MKHANRMVVLSISDDLIMCKLASPVDKIAQTITDKEKAEFALNTQLVKVETKLNDYKIKS